MAERVPVPGQGGDVSGNLHAIRGTTAPGDPIGRLRVSGDYVQDSQATLEIDIDGGNLAYDAFDRLIVMGDASLGGSLQLEVHGPIDATGGTSAPHPGNPGERRESV